MSSGSYSAYCCVPRSDHARSDHAQRARHILPVSIPPPDQNCVVPCVETVLYKTGRSGEHAGVADLVVEERSENVGTTEFFESLRPSLENIERELACDGSVLDVLEVLRFYCHTLETAQGFDRRAYASLLDDIVRNDAGRRGPLNIFPAL